MPRLLRFAVLCAAAAVVSAGLGASGSASRDAYGAPAEAHAVVTTRAPWPGRSPSPKRPASPVQPARSPLSGCTLPHGSVRPARSLLSPGAQPTRSVLAARYPQPAITRPSRSVRPARYPTSACTRPTGSVRPARHPQPVSAQSATTANIEAAVPSGVLSLFVTGTSLSAGSGGALVSFRVVDTQAGDQPWVITALASGSQNVGLTGLTASSVPGNALTAADLTLADQPPAAARSRADRTGYTGLGGTAPHVIVTDAGQADGTIGVSGLLTFSAGAFAGTITVTIAT